jgi:hypothetical protein
VKTHYELLFAAIPLIVLGPVFEAYYFFVAAAPVSGLFKLFSSLLLFSGTLALLFVVNKLRSLELAYLAPTLAYLGVNILVIANVSSVVEALGALFYVEAFWFFSLGIFSIARFADGFDCVSKAAPFLKIFAVLLLGVPTLMTVASVDFASGSSSWLFGDVRLIAGVLFAGCGFALFSILYWFDARLRSIVCRVDVGHLSARDVALAKQPPRG